MSTLHVRIIMHLSAGELERYYPPGSKVNKKIVTRKLFPLSGGIPGITGMNYLSGGSNLNFECYFI